MKKAVSTEQMKPYPQIVAAINISRIGDEESLSILGDSSASKLGIVAKIFWAIRLLCLLYCFGCNCSIATVIVGFRTPSQVVIAADGLQGVVNSAEITVKRITACKIFSEGHGVYMTAGGVSFKAAPDVSISFDEPFFSETRRGENMSKQVRNAIEAFDSKTRAAWKSASMVAPQFYAKTIAGHSTQLIIGWVDGPDFGLASYSAIPQADGSSSVPQWAIYPNNEVLSDTPFVWVIDGDASNATNRKLRNISNRTAPLPTNLPEFARTLIQDEIRADKTHRSVGHPIDVLVMDTKGTRWYKKEHRSKCPPIAPR
jgi:hypothetical protein